MKRQAGRSTGSSAVHRKQLIRTPASKKQAAAPRGPQGKRGRGRPVGTLKPVVITPQQMVEAAEAGCTNEEIASLAGLSSDTLVKRFKKELEMGRALRKFELRKKQYEQAKLGNGTMLVWLGKNELGQTDRAEDTVDFTYDLNNLSRDELERFAAGQPIKKILSSRERA